MSRSHDDPEVRIVAQALAQIHGKDVVSAGSLLRARQILHALEEDGYDIVKREPSSEAGARGDQDDRVGQPEKAATRSLQREDGIWDVVQRIREP